jgi:hypothetical protein
MKLLLDTCVWGGAKAELQANGHDVVWTGDLPVDRRALSKGINLYVSRTRRPGASTQVHFPSR